MNALEFALAFIACVVIWFFSGLIGLVVLASVIALVYAASKGHKEKNDEEEEKKTDRMLAKGYVFDIETSEWIEEKEMEG